MYAEIGRLVLILDEHGRGYDINKIKKAYNIACKLHEGQYRQSGEPYISHPIAVAETVASLGLDTDAVCAALLHDTLEDCADKINMDEITKEFGKDVADLVDGLTKLVQIPFEDKEEEHFENLRKMFMAMSKDVRVLFIKLSDRLHNMRTLYAKKEASRRMIALETMQVYAPLAHRLGMQRIKQELENLSLKYLDPDGYVYIEEAIAKKYGENKDFIERTRNILDTKLSENALSFEIKGRVKSVYSIYNKMYNQHKNFDEIYDFYALRILTRTELDCYAVLGIIHDAFKSIPGRFKDYISTPKDNQYRSLHTTVIGRDGIPFEVQIRTYDMHRVAEYGVAAHWKYKTGEQSREDIDKKLEWVSKMFDPESHSGDSDELIQALKTEIVQDEIFVFTPKGDVVTLPQGATMIDFDYAIHSAVGNRMIGAKVNGVITQIDKSPDNGDIIEIITSSSSKGPSRDWIKIVKTSEARNKIRQWFKKEKRSENIQLGKNEIEKEMRRFGRVFTSAQRDEVLLAVSHRLGIQGIDDLYNTIGYGGLTVAKILPKLKDTFDKIVVEESQGSSAPLTAEDIVTKPRKKNSSGVVIDGVDGCEVRFAKCCCPIPGDAIVGFITKGFGITIHKSDCPNAVASSQIAENRDRFVSAKWESGITAMKKDAGAMFEASIVVLAENSLTLLANVTLALADQNVDLHNISTKQKGDDMLINMVVGCKNIEHFRQIMTKLTSVDHVYEVRRGTL